MVDIQTWLIEYQRKMLEIFQTRVCFIGIQGSYARGETHENSDIDVVLILDQLSIEDLKCYKNAIDTLKHRELICGFISGKDELMHWQKADLFQFYHDTIPVYKDLSFIKNQFDDTDIQNAVLIGTCNLYHAAVHNFLHEQSLEILKGLKKSAIFILQAKYFLETHEFVSSHEKLARLLKGEDQRIIYLECLDLKDSEILIQWAGSLIK